MGLKESYEKRKREEANDKAREFLNNNNRGDSTKEGCQKVFGLLGIGIIFMLIMAAPPIGFSVLAIVVLYLFFSK